MASTEQSFWVEEIAGGLDFPRAIEWLPDGSYLLAEWAGDIVHMRDGKQIGVIKGVPKVFVAQYNGLRDLKLDPDFATNKTVYLSYTAGDLSQGENAIFGRIYKARLEGDTLVDGKVIFNTVVPSGIMLMGPILFQADKTLMVSVGSMVQEEIGLVQRMDNHSGKMIRINRDGSIPKDNPYLKDKDALPEIWAIGLRNTSGMARLNNGELWGVDIGPKGGDELNKLKPGANFGWPLVTWGFDYSGQAMSTFTGSARQEGGEGFINPTLVWTPAFTPSGLIQYSGDAYPGWKGDLFVGGLSGQSVRRLRLDGDEVVLQQRMLMDLHERIRSVDQGPDGYIYLLTDKYQTGRILRLMPGTPPPGAKVAKALTADAAQKEPPSAWAKQIAEARSRPYDPARAAQIFEQNCASCHSFGKFTSGEIGPNLNGVNGRASGTLDNYDYSASFRDPKKRVRWSSLTLGSFLINPDGYFPGTKMAAPPTSAADRAEIVRYLTDNKD